MSEESGFCLDELIAPAPPLMSRLPPTKPYFGTTPTVLPVFQRETDRQREIVDATSSKRQIAIQLQIRFGKSQCNRTSQRKCNQYATAHCNFGTSQRNLSANSNNNRKSRTPCSAPSRKAGHVKSLLCSRVPSPLVQAKTSSLPLAVRGLLQPLGLRGYGKECKETSPQCNKVQIFATMMATCSNSISTR